MDTISTVELAAIKKAICSHFNLSVRSSNLVLRQRNTLTLQGHNKYYDLIIQDSLKQHKVFGKLSPYADKEYHNLHYIQKNVVIQGIRLPRPIALVEIGKGSLLLQEYLEGYSHILANRKLEYYLPGRIETIENEGKVILDKIYRMQERFPVSYRPLSSNDVIGIPNQPKPIGVHDQLSSMHTLSEETKKHLSTKLNSILKKNSPLRRGLIHGDLGMRNIMICNSNISFIDWDYMQVEGVSLIDPCFFVVMLLMRSVQLFVPWKKITSLGDNLFRQIKFLEETIDDSSNATLINDSIWLGKCLSLIDTLWWYEKDENNYLQAIMKQRSRQIKYLTYLLDQEAADEKY